MEGAIGIKPVIKKISFPSAGKMQIHLEDGRLIVVPLSLFPSIKKLPPSVRKRWYIMDDELFSFDGSNEVFHIEQVLGKEEEYKYLR